MILRTLIATVTLALVSMPARAAVVPTDIPGLKTWVDAGAITGLADLDPVGRWDDLSGNNVDFISPLVIWTPGHYPQAPIYKTDVVNGLPVVRFDPTYPDGDNRQMMTTWATTDHGSTPLSLSGPMTMFYVAARYDENDDLAS